MNVYATLAQIRAYLESSGADMSTADDDTVLEFLYLLPFFQRSVISLYPFLFLCSLLSLIVVLNMMLVCDKSHRLGLLSLFIFR